MMIGHWQNSNFASRISQVFYRAFEATKADNKDCSMSINSLLQKDCFFTVNFGCKIFIPSVRFPLSLTVLLSVALIASCLSRLHLFLCFTTSSL
jgi:hypothetical protein